MSTAKSESFEKKRTNIRAIQTVDVFGSEPALKIVAENAIAAVDLPWDCAKTVKDSAKIVALQSVYGGTHPTDFIRTLAPSVFKTQKDARHAMVKLSAIAWSAVDRNRWHELRVKTFEWVFIEHLCDFPEHRSLNGRKFSTDVGHKGEFPSARYGCRCMGSPVI